MRLLGLVLGLAVLLFVRAQFYRVAGHVTAGNTAPVPMLKYQPPAYADIDSNDIVAEMNPKIDIDTRPYEELAIRKAGDDAVRQERMAQDQAWAASHPDE